MSALRGRLLGVTIAAVLAGSTAAGAQCEAGNLLPNCGFEADTAGWDELWSDDFFRTTADAHLGVASAAEWGLVEGLFRAPAGSRSVAYISRCDDQLDFVVRVDDFGFRISPLFFSDGFESGDTAVWSATAGG